MVADRSAYAFQPFARWWLREIPATVQAIWDLFVVPPTDVVLGNPESIR